jgi:uncharacterized protein (TIGR03083 family)
MKAVEPIIVAHLFPEMLDSLVALLSGLSAEEWSKPTVCEGWDVRDVALHLLWVDISNLSRKRDGYSPSTRPLHNEGDLLKLINELNATWVRAGSRISPRLLCDLIRFVGAQVCECFASLDPFAMGEPVSWAGPDPAPVWLDLAREHTERWHHQQHIRDAVGKPGLKEPRYFAPVLDAFARALPHTFRLTSAADGTLVALTISGQAGGGWFLLRQSGGWELYRDIARQPDAEVLMDQDLAWRVFTKGISRERAQAETTIHVRTSLGMKVLDMVSIIA